MDNEKTPRRGYPWWGWLIAVLLCWPALFLMLVGYAIPSTRRYLGAPGVIIASIALVVVVVVAGVCVDTLTTEQATDVPKPTNAPVPTMQTGIARRYTITREVDSTVFASRTRATLNIYAPTATTYPDRYATVRKAAQDYIRSTSIDVVVVRQFEPAETGSAVARVIYSPDGCGWVGEKCTGEIWRVFD